MRTLHIVADNVFMWTNEDECGRQVEFERAIVGPRLKPGQMISHGIRTWLYVRWPFAFRQPVLKVREE